VSTDDEFEAVRRDPDPIRRGQRATSLLTTYQQRSTELARLRKAAIEEAHQQHGLSYTEIATRLGITKGRITQIRSDAPGSADIAYVARHRFDSRVIVHIAGIHTLGSLAAAHYLASHVTDLVEQVGDRSLSMVVRGTYDGMTIASSGLVAGPFGWW